jgi:LmbE family N-acetylglucosaminyl deacetylase
MKLTRNTAEIFVPDGVDEQTALARTTHMGIGAHADDLEIMAADGILRCFGRDDAWFCGVVVTDSAGSPRAGLYADYSDEQMRAVRRREQIKAAVVGEYGAQVLLDYSSATIKDPTNTATVDDLATLVAAAAPLTIYTHNLADRHDTHVAVAVKLIEAIRRLEPEQRPQHLYGCEVWRDLDWLIDEDRVVFDLSQQENLQLALVGVHDSQISGGKRYDLATSGRRQAHATYLASHGVDAAARVSLACDLTPLIADPGQSVAEFMRGPLDRFKTDVLNRIETFITQ